MELVKLNEFISYAPASQEPLSAEVIFIYGEKNTYIYDVGRIPEVADYIRDIHNAVVIISHFHADHCENIHNLDPQKLYVGKYTGKSIHKGEVVSEDMYLEERDLKLHIFPLPSCHAKGCLGLEVNGEIAFIGDAMYGRLHRQQGEEYNYQVLQNEIEVLRKLDAQTIYLGHRLPLKARKKGVLSFLEEHLSKIHSKS